MNELNLSSPKTTATTLPIINFFRVELIRNSVSAVLRLLFKDKWLKENGQEWKSEYGNLVAKKLKKSKVKFNNSNNDDDYSTAFINVESHNLSSWDLDLISTILISYPWKIKDEQENQIILKLNDINKNYLNNVKNRNNKVEKYEIEECKYQEIRQGFLNGLKCLEAMEQGELSLFIKEIEKRIDEIPSKEAVDRYKIGGDSEEEKDANKFVDRGEIEFENQNYQRAIDCYNDALLYNGLNDIKRSYILSRLSMINLRYYQHMMLDGEYSYLFYIKKQQLEDSKRDAISSCSLSPLLHEGYFRGAQILCFLGSLKEALTFIDAAIYLDPFNQEIILFKQQIQMKIDSRSWITDDTEINGRKGETRRDFEKEAEQFIEAHKYSNYYDGEDLQLHVYTKGIDEMARLYHLPRQHFVNIACSRVAGTYAKKKNHELARKYLSHAAGGDFAICAYRLGSIYERGLGVEKDLNTALSLYYEASLKPLKFDIPDDIPDMRPENKELMERNEGVTMANIVLGHIFSKGIGAEIDIDQAIYYFQSAVDQSNSTEAMLALSQIYFYGMTPSAVSNKKKAIELVKRGFDLGDKDCQREYYHYTGITPPNKLTGEGINASLKTLIIIVSLVILVTSIAYICSPLIDNKLLLIYRLLLLLRNQYIFCAIEHQSKENLLFIIFI